MGYEGTTNGKQILLRAQMISTELQTAYLFKDTDIGKFSNQVLYLFLRLKVSNNLFRNEILLLKIFR